MHVKRTVDIAAPPDKVWAVVADIENAVSTISGIEKVEVLEPATGPSIVGLKWRETRTWMGREATEVMWVTDAADGSFYQTRAESHGAVYQSRMAVEPTATGTRLSMGFDSEAVTTGAKVMWALTGWMAKRSLKKVIDKDLGDIKAAVEGRA